MEGWEKRDRPPEENTPTASLLIIPGCSINPAATAGSQHAQHSQCLSREGGWLDLDRIKLIMDLGLQILFKKEALYMKMKLLTWALSYMSRGGDSLRSHLFDAGSIHLQDAWPAWDLCRCPWASWERSPEDSSCRGPGSTAGISTCSSPGSCRCCLVFPDAAVMCLPLAVLFYVFVSCLWWVRSAAKWALTCDWN